jgi:hypothetical protein
VNDYRHAFPKDRPALIVAALRFRANTFFCHSGYRGNPGGSLKTPASAVTALMAQA